MLIEKNDAANAITSTSVQASININNNNNNVELNPSTNGNENLNTSPKRKTCNNPDSTTAAGKLLMNISAYSMQGRRTHMEDYFDIGYMMKPVDQQRLNEWPYEYFYFGMFDGHGGCEAAKFAKENLLKFITKQACFWSDKDEDVMNAIRIGYADTHAAMKQKLSTWSRTNRILPSTAGTTVSVLFIKNGKFYSGHVGDSRIVISRGHPETKQWISEQVTNDHKPESEKEIERIERAGGEVKSKIGVHRVVWRRPILKREFDIKLNPRHPDYNSCLEQTSTYPLAESLVESYQIIPFLAIARSLGDFWSINPYSGQYVVSPEPDVTCRLIDAQDKSILLATDGLWNVMNSSQAVRFLQELRVVKKGKRDKKRYSQQYFATDNFYDVSLPQHEKNHALSLVYMAYQIWERRRLRSDNITAIVAMISDILPPLQNTTHSRRSSRHLTSDAAKIIYSKEYIEANTVQLGQTHIFCEPICSDSKPDFFANPGSDEDIGILEKIEDYLVFPPTLLSNDSKYVTGPKNYTRLSNAKCRKLVQRDQYYADTYIYIKRVSDDPADEMKLPTRMNKKSIRVRDSSAQASQPIHDFGQPWDQLLDDEELVFEHELDELEIRSSSRKSKDELIPKGYYVGFDYYQVVDEDEDDEDENENEDEEEDGTDNVESDDDEEERQADEDEEDEEEEQAQEEDDHDVDGDIDLEVEVKLDELVVEIISVPDADQPSQAVKEQDKSISQLRCLMNRSETPTSRRTTRSGAYLSVTENPKRKMNPNPELPKSKRRRSLPIHESYALAQT